MSIQNIEAFYKHALKNPGLAKGLMGAPDMPTFERNVVEIGNTAGFDFSAGEAHEWIKQKLAREAAGELDDYELEAVAGGKGGVPSNNNFYSQFGPMAGLTTVAPARGPIGG